MPDENFVSFLDLKDTINQETVSIQGLKRKLRKVEKETSTNWVVEEMAQHLRAFGALRKDLGLVASTHEVAHIYLNSTSRGSHTFL